MTKRFIVTERGLDHIWSYAFETLEEAELKYDSIEVEPYPGIEIISLSILTKEKTSIKSDKLRNDIK